MLVAKAVGCSPSPQSASRQLPSKGVAQFWCSVGCSPSPQSLRDSLFLPCFRGHCGWAMFATTGDLSPQRSALWLCRRLRGMAMAQFLKTFVLLCLKNFSPCAYKIIEKKYCVQWTKQGAWLLFISVRRNWDPSICFFTGHNNEVLWWYCIFHWTVKGDVYSLWSHAREVTNGLFGVFMWSWDYTIVPLLPNRDEVDSKKLFKFLKNNSFIQSHDNDAGDHVVARIVV